MDQYLRLELNDKWRRVGVFDQGRDKYGSDVQAMLSSVYVQSDDAARERQLARRQRRALH